jgi:peptidoglycan DL-endopeptidase CwlO
VHELRSRRRWTLRSAPANAGKLALAVGICVCAGQLMAGPAAAAPVQAAPASATAAVRAAAVAPKVAFGANTRRLPWGSALRLSAKVTDPGTGKAVAGQVRFQAWKGGRWATVATRTVSSAGAASISFRTYTAHTYRAVYLGGGATHTSAASGKVWVAVVASRAKVLSVARKLVGKPYRYAASGPSAFDCSGFTKYVYRKATGRVLPHKANSQQRYGKAVAKSKALPGDLIVIRNGSYGYHVGIYAGAGYMYDSPKPGTTVGKHKIWSSSYVVRRLV